MERDQLVALRNMFESGKLSRQEYWEKMRKMNVELRGYESILAGGIAEAIEITNDGLCLRTLSGAKFVWNPENLREPCSVVVNHGDYEPGVRRVLSACARDRSCIVDVGANIGWYTVILSLMVGARGRVIAFEPVEKTKMMLDKNISLNKFESSVETVCRGLSSTAGSGEMFLPETSGHIAASLRDLHTRENRRTVLVTLSTLDEEIRVRNIGRVDLVKCDVEGAELLVLEGSRMVIERDLPIVLLELLRKWAARFDYHPNDVLEWMNSYGYRCFSIGEYGLSECDMVTDETVETNFVFLQRPRDDCLIDALQ